MGGVAALEPLLSNGVAGHGYSKSTPLLVSLTRWVLKSLMWLLFLTWVAVIILFPIELVKILLNKWITITSKSIFGVTGSIFLGFSAPILIIAFLAFFYITSLPKDYFEIIGSDKSAIGMRASLAF